MVLIAWSRIIGGAYESAIRRKRKAPPERGSLLTLINVSHAKQILTELQVYVKYIVKISKSCFNIIDILPHL